MSSRFQEVEEDINRLNITINAIIDELEAWKTRTMRLSAAIRREHFSNNGSSVYMNGIPQHERSMLRCSHPLCAELNK